MNSIRFLTNYSLQSFIYFPDVGRGVVTNSLLTDWSASYIKQITIWHLVRLVNLFLERQQTSFTFHSSKITTLLGPNPNQFPITITATMQPQGNKTNVPLPWGSIGAWPPKLLCQWGKVPIRLGRDVGCQGNTDWAGFHRRDHTLASQRPRKILDVARRMWPNPIARFIKYKL